MRQGLLRGDALELREGRLSERPSGSRQHQAPHFSARSAAQTLMQRVVLAIHRKKFAPRFLGCGHHQLARRNQHFLVGERNRLSQLHRLVGRFQPHHAHCRRDHHIRFRMRGDGQHTLPAMVNLRLAREAFFSEPLRKIVGAPCVGHGHHFRLKPCNLPRQFFEVRPGSQRDHAESSRQRLHHRKALPPNRTRRAQDSKLLHEVSASLWRELKSFAVG